MILSYGSFSKLIQGPNIEKSLIKKNPSHTYLSIYRENAMMPGSHSSQKTKQNKRSIDDKECQTDCCGNCFESMKIHYLFSLP